MIGKIAHKSAMDAFIISNNYSCRDVLANFSHFVPENSDFIVPCVHEVLAESNGQQFTSKIENFSDNVVINGAKSYVPGADKATHFLTFVGIRGQIEPV